MCSSDLLLKVAAGMLEPDRGERVVQRGASVRYLPQEPDLSGFATVRDYIDAGMDSAEAARRAHDLLAQVGFEGGEPAGTLSGGEARRCALVRVMAPAPDILLLDEPTNHLDLPAIEWLEKTLAELRSTLVLISHDRRFLERLSRATVWLDRGVTRRIDRGFAAFETWRDEFLEQEERERHKLDRKIVAELSWLRYGVTARRRRNQGRLRALQDLRQERRDQRGAAGAVKMTVGDAAYSGKLVIDAEGINKSFGDQRVIRDLSLRVLRGDRLGIVGPNGAGKTTLLNLLTGASAPDSGSVRIGANVQMVMLDQGRAALDPSQSLKRALTGDAGDIVRIGNTSKHVASYMKDFLFAPEQAPTPLSALSGGERARVMLARALAQPSNLLVLDEPTNDLDLETLDLLQEMLADYAGTVLLVSHDRDFIDRVATSVLVFEGRGRWIEYAGGYTDMVAQRGAGVSALARPGPAKAAPTKPPPAAAPPPQRPRLDSKQRQALRTLPTRIATLEKTVAQLQATLADPELFARDPTRFNAAAAELNTTTAALATAENEWLELEMLREATESR